MSPATTRSPLSPVVTHRPSLAGDTNEDLLEEPDCVAVWSVAVGEWRTIKLWPNCVVGWVK